MGWDGGMELGWGVFAVAVDGSLQIPVWIDLTRGVGEPQSSVAFLVCVCVCVCVRAGPVSKTHRGY